MVVLMLVTSKAVAAENGRILFGFHGEEAAARWTTVTDGVMGGRSEGRFSITEDHHLKFHGTLSLEHNGGFSSVRSRDAAFNLQAGDTIVIRLRGDGREYSLNLYDSSPRRAFSFRSEFKTISGEWREIRLPLDGFVATSFGRRLPDRRLDPKKIAGVGLLIADKQAGTFELEVAWIKVNSDSDVSAD
jgi:monofunctional biosynthetic peptidoglycan transglycosylase